MTDASRRVRLVRHVFVESIPDALETGVLYVSIRHETVVHACCCGCGGEVVTPLSPTDWALRFDGETVSLEPSIGNWSFPCRSHYWITRGRVDWVPAWSKRQIDRGRELDAARKQDAARQPRHGDPSVLEVSVADSGAREAPDTTQRVRQIWRWFRRRLGR